MYLLYNIIYIIKIVGKNRPNVSKNYTRQVLHFEMWRLSLSPSPPYSRKYTFNTYWIISSQCLSNAYLVNNDILPE